MKCKFADEKGFCSKYESKQCKFDHPPECKSKGKCWNKSCKFLHPNAACVFQDKCNKKEQCPYRHFREKRHDEEKEVSASAISKSLQLEVDKSLKELDKTLNESKNTVFLQNQKVEEAPEELKAQLKGIADALSTGLEQLKQQKMTVLEKIADIKFSNLEKREKVLRIKRELFRLKSKLPALAKRREIEGAVRNNRFVVIQGQTGSGKSTQLPQYIADMQEFAGKKVMCTQPRKLAAVALTERVAFEYGAGEVNKTHVGWLVGYHVGGIHKVSKNTRIEFVTEDYLVRGLLTHDLDLTEYSCIIIDEAHERNISTDLLLGLLRNHQSNVRVIVTSATLEKELFVTYFGNCPLIQIPGRTFPVEVIYSPSGLLEDDSKILETSISKCFEIHMDTPINSGDILCFLTGQDEVEKAQQRFADIVAKQQKKAVAFSLFGKQLPEEQQKVFQPAPKGVRKVIFATDVAETSLTIDGVRHVVDTGLAKDSIYDTQRNISALRIIPITKSSAEQRKGRAGRTSSGTCYRLYSEEDYISMRDGNIPEIKKRPLGLTAINLLVMKIDLATFDWIEKPDKAAVVYAMNELVFLGAITETKVLTDIGVLISQLQIEPALGRMVYFACKQGLGDAATTIVGLLGVSSNLFWRGGDQNAKKQSDEKHKRFFKENGDIVTLFHIFKEWQDILHSKEKLIEQQQAQELILDEVYAKLAASLQDSNINEEKEENDTELSDNESVSSETSIENQENEVDTSGGSSASASIPMTPVVKELEETKVSKNANARIWCRDNSINNKSLGIALATKKEIQRVLKKTELWASKSQTKNPTDLEILNLLFKAYFLNMAFRIKKGTYRTVLSDTIALLHPGSSLKHLNLEPDWLIFQTVLKTHKTMLVHVNPCIEKWIEEESPSFKKLLENKKAEAHVAVPFEQVGKYAIKSIFGKFNSNVPKLENELQCTLEVDYETDGIILWCKASVRDKNREIMKKKIEEAKEALKNEVLEESLVGNTRAVYGMGAVLTDILFEGEFIALNLRNLPSNWTIANIIKIASTYGPIRDCTLVNQGSESNLQWSKVTFMNKVDAKRAFTELSGEVLGSKTIVVSPSGINAPSMLHQISGHIVITWANGFSTGQADLTYLSATSANAVLRRNPFGAKLMPYGQKPGKTPKGKPKPPLDVNNLFLESGSGSNFSLSITGLSPQTDEQEIENILKTCNLPLPQRINLKRNPIPNNSDKTISEDVADILSVLQFSKNVYSRTTFNDEKRLKGGCRVFYKSLEDLLKEVSSLLGAPTNYRCNQPIRVEVKYTCSVAIHKSLWKKFKNKIDEAMWHAKKSNIMIKEDQTSPYRVVLQLTSSNHNALIATRHKLDNALECSVFQNPDKHVLFTNYGRQKLQKLSDSTAYLHWDNANGIIRIYGSKKEQEEATAALQQLIDDLKSMEVEVPLLIQKYYRPTPQEVNSLKNKHNLKELQLTRGRLIATGVKESVAALKKDISSQLVEPKKIIRSEDCLICYDTLDNPFTLDISFALIV